MISLMFKCCYGHAIQVHVIDFFPNNYRIYFVSVSLFLQVDAFADGFGTLGKDGNSFVILLQKFYVSV